MNSIYWYLKKPAVVASGVAFKLRLMSSLNLKATYPLNP